MDQRIVWKTTFNRNPLGFGIVVDMDFGGGHLSRLEQEAATNGEEGAGGGDDAAAVGFVLPF